jgi:hypothetical protein
MLGNKIIEGQGKATTVRVLPGDDYRFHKLEISFQENGTVLGIPYTNLGTYVFFERIPGQLYGEGRGIYVTNEGEGAIWTATGIGRMTGQGMGQKFSGAALFQASGDGKLAPLKDYPEVFEFEADDQNNITISGWEWKAP